MKKITIASIVLSIFLLTSTKSYASVNCETIYGGGQNCTTKGEVDIDKKVKDSGSGKYVDNLSIEHYKYKAGENVSFEIKVTNTGDASLSRVEVKDIIPENSTFVSGPGNYDSNSRTLTYTLNDLKAKESRVNYVVVKVANETNMCVVNQAIASSEGMRDQDNSQYCIEKINKVLPPPTVKQTPPTGPGLLGVLGLIPVAFTGLYLRSKIKLK